MDRGAERIADQAIGLAQHRVELNRADIELLGARKGQKLAGQLGALFRGRSGVVGETARRMILGQLARQQLQVAADGHQQVVEVVSNAAGQLADGLHLLRLAQRLLGGGQLRLGAKARADVLGVMESADNLAGRIAQRRVPDLPVRAVQGRIAELLHHAEHLAGQGAGHEAADDRRLFGQEQVREHVADLHAIAVDAEKLVAVGRVEGDQPEVLVERADRSPAGLANDLPQIIRSGCHSRAFRHAQRPCIRTSEST